MVPINWLRHEEQHHVDGNKSDVSEVVVRTKGDHGVVPRPEGEDLSDVVQTDGVGNP